MDSVSIHKIHNLYNTYTNQFGNGASHNLRFKNYSAFYYYIATCSYEFIEHANDVHTSISYTCLSAVTLHCDLSKHFKLNIKTFIQVLENETTTIKHMYSGCCFIPKLNHRQCIYTRLL